MSTWPSLVARPIIFIKISGAADSGVRRTASQGGKMASKRGTGIHVVMTDVEASDLDAYSRWYEEEHIPERVALDGVLSARRFRLDNRGPQPSLLASQYRPAGRFLVTYELEDPSVIEGEQWIEVNRRPSPLSVQMISTMRNVVRGTYTLLNTFE
jgi:hypothetical protein